MGGRTGWDCAGLKCEDEGCCVRGDWAEQCVDVNLLNGAWWVGVACRGGMGKLAVLA